MHYCESLWISVCIMAYIINPTGYANESIVVLVKSDFTSMSGLMHVQL